MLPLTRDVIISAHHLQSTTGCGGSIWRRNDGTQMYYCKGIYYIKSYCHLSSLKNKSIMIHPPLLSYSSLLSLSSAYSYIPYVLISSTITMTIGGDINNRVERTVRVERITRQRIRIRVRVRVPIHLTILGISIPFRISSSDTTKSYF